MDADTQHSCSILPQRQPEEENEAMIVEEDCGVGQMGLKVLNSNSLLGLQGDHENGNVLDGSGVT